MRICVIAENSSLLDEGVKNTGLHLIKRISKNHEVMSFPPRSVLSLDFWRAVKQFDPQIIHYIPGSTLVAFMILKTLSVYRSKSKTVLSAIHPLFSLSRSRARKVIPWLRPDLVIVQSYAIERMLSGLGCQTAFLPSGVDLAKFFPVDDKTKKAMRKRYGLDEGKFTVLHVGHMLRSRNLGVFKRILATDSQVVIVGSPSTRKPERQVYLELKQNGCVVWNDYIENIEEIYALSDCYIFPVAQPAGCIEMPLSVMEAMACNLPVISTRFGALPRAFEEGDGLIFVEDEGELIEKLEIVKGVEVRTREKVLPYSWENVARQLEVIYRKLTS